MEHNDNILYITYESAMARMQEVAETEAECPAVTVWGDTAEPAVI